MNLRKLFPAIFLVMSIMAITATDAFAEALMLVGIDISTSSAFTDPGSDQMIRQAAQHVYEVARQMDRGDSIVIRTIGEYGPGTTNEIAINISKKNPPERAAAMAATLLAQVPRNISEGTWKQANATNIVWFLRDSAEQADCTRHPVLIMVFSDGLESSDYVSESEMLAGTGTLPAFNPPFLAGCSIAMHGVGQRAGETTLSVSDALVASWTAFFTANGATAAYVTPSIPR